MFNLNEGLIYCLFNGSSALPYALVIGIVFVMAAAYLLGSINSAIILSKIFYGDDIRKHGSGNAGTTNMLRTYGKSAALMTLGGDVLKTAIAVLISGIVFGFGYVGGVSTSAASIPGICYVAGLFAIIGHIFPIFYKFRGGKGVLSTATVILILSPISFAILMTLFIAIVWVSKYVSLGSVSAVILLPVVLHSHFIISFGQGSAPGLATLSAVIIAVLIVWCHRTNLQRISNKTESKLSFGSKKEKPSVKEEADGSNEE